LPLFSGPRCEVCGHPLKTSQAPTAGTCQFCRESPLPPQTRLISLGRYEGILARLIQDLKFRGNTEIAPELARLSLDLLQASLPSERQEWLIVPVPLHPRRLRERGFNQSLLIARELSKKLQIDLDFTSLRKVRHTQAQMSLSRAERTLNLSGAFHLAPTARWHDRSILLIDDVFTTGSTIKACLPLLLEQGQARQVCIFTIARTLNDDHSNNIAAPTIPASPDLAPDSQGNPEVRLDSLGRQ
jgi:ComF family protein